MKKPNTAHMKENCRCVKCGWPIIFTCCNDDMQRLPWGDVGLVDVLQQ